MPFNQGGKGSLHPLSRKLLLVMLSTSFLLVIILLRLGTPQLSQRVTISGKDMRLEQVFTEIKKQTGFEFICESSILKNSKPVTLDVKQAPLEEVLTICLKWQGLGFSIRNGIIVVFRLDERGISFSKNFV